MAETADKTAKYRAPALEKGLDVLELLSRSSRPMTLSQISNELNRSVSELFRMVQVLELRGYVADSQTGEGFELTNKLFSLGLSRGPSQNLLLSALPLMQTLAERTQQSCHLTIASDDRIVVIARIETPRDEGFSVRVGYQRALVRSTSGVVLYAFQRPQIREQWQPLLQSRIEADEWKAFEGQAQKARTQGYFRQKSHYIDGIIDLSCPIHNDIGTVAALTMPFIRVANGVTEDEALNILIEQARAISQSLGGVPLNTDPPNTDPLV